MNKLPVSVCMISGAEAHRIGASLESVVGWAGEIIVVLNDDVKDGTEEILRLHGANIFREPWKGHIAQKNSAARKAAHAWILGLDADEVVSPRLRDEIQHLFAQKEELSRFAAFSFPRLAMFCGRWIRHGDWQPRHITRLWRKDMGEWGGVDPHDKLLVRGKVGKLHNHLLHYTAAEIDHQLAKISGYTNDFVRDALQRRRRATSLDLVFRPAWRFIRAYFFRLGFLDGWPGYYIAWMVAFEAITRYAKVRFAQEIAT